MLVVMLTTSGVSHLTSNVSDLMSFYKKAPDLMIGGSIGLAATYSPAWCSSTIGAGGLNGPVRNGKGWSPAA